MSKVQTPKVETEQPLAVGENSEQISQNEYVRRVNREITQNVNPLYNVFLVLSAACFGYFVYSE